MNFTEQFPVLNAYTYLNTAGSGLLSKPLLDWRHSHDKEFLNQGSLYRANKDTFLQEVRSNVARFFNAEADRTFLVPNFSCGFNIFLEGLNGPQRFLLLKEDYPSVNYPVESRGHTCDYVETSERLEENILKSIRDFKPTVFAFSLVQYISGIKIDLDFLKSLKKEFPDLLVAADGTQFCGTAAFDFQQSGIDALIASSYKWMLGGYGNGFVLLKEMAAEQLYANAKNWPLPGEDFLQDRRTLSLYFEPGHLDTLNFGTLSNAILDLERLGMDVIEKNISRLSLKAKEAFAARNLLSAMVLRRKQHSSIFNLDLSEAIYDRLQQKGILCTWRGTGVRVSFHFYNTDQDLHRLLEVIDQED